MGLDPFCGLGGRVYNERDLMRAFDGKAVVHGKVVGRHSLALPYQQLALRAHERREVEGRHAHMVCPLLNSSTTNHLRLRWQVSDECTGQESMGGQVGQQQRQLPRLLVPPRLLPTELAQQALCRLKSRSGLLQAQAQLCGLGGPLLELVLEGPHLLVQLQHRLLALLDAIPSSLLGLAQHCKLVLQGRDLLQHLRVPDVGYDPSSHGRGSNTHTLDVGRLK
mmetsp:Transcript_32615/g.52876  ORF Transcript_32615/g.52876 Transcript_32615/m.52876 type:complete len:222 (-) Transcript_32615:1202-1867(-)